MPDQRDESLEDMFPEHVKQFVDMLERLSRYSVFEMEVISRDLGIDFEPDFPHNPRHSIARLSSGPISRVKLFGNPSPFVSLDCRPDAMSIMQADMHKKYSFWTRIYHVSNPLPSSYYPDQDWNELPCYSSVFFTFDA